MVQSGTPATRRRARLLRPKFDLATRRSFPRRRPHPRPRRQLKGGPFSNQRTNRCQKNLGKADWEATFLSNKTRATRSRLLSNMARIAGFFSKTPPAATPNRRVRPLFPPQPPFSPMNPAQFRSSRPFRQKQIPSSNYSVPMPDEDDLKMSAEQKDLLHCGQPKRTSR